jgi:hypothetical protein
MKTAMQELIEYIQVNAIKFSLMNTYNKLKEIEPYLEKEKEQICNAYTDGLEGPYLGAEQYYNQTYNQNK